MLLDAHRGTFQALPYIASPSLLMYVYHETTIPLGEFELACSKKDKVSYFEILYSNFYYELKNGSWESVVACFTLMRDNHNTSGSNTTLTRT